MWGFCFTWDNNDQMKPRRRGREAWGGVGGVEGNEGRRKMKKKKPRLLYRIMEVFILEVNSKEISKVVSCYIGY